MKKLIALIALCASAAAFAAVETVEIADHPFFVGVQFHPEFKSRPNRPHPIFRKFVESALTRSEA